MQRESLTRRTRSCFPIVPNALCRLPLFSSGVSDTRKWKRLSRGGGPLASISAFPFPFPEQLRFTVCLWTVCAVHGLSASLLLLLYQSDLELVCLFCPVFFFAG